MRRFAILLNLLWVILTWDATIAFDMVLVTGATKSGLQELGPNTLFGLYSNGFDHWIEIDNPDSDNTSARVVWLSENLKAHPERRYMFERRAGNVLLLHPQESLEGVTDKEIEIKATCVMPVVEIPLDGLEQFISLIQWPDGSTKLRLHYNKKYQGFEVNVLEDVDVNGESHELEYPLIPATVLITDPDRYCSTIYLILDVYQKANEQNADAKTHYVHLKLLNDNYSDIGESMSYDDVKKLWVNKPLMEATDKGRDKPK